MGPVRPPQYHLLGTGLLVGWGGEARAGSRKKAGMLRGLEPRPSSAGCATTSTFCFFFSSFHTLKGEKQNLNVAVSHVQ